MKNNKVYQSEFSIMNEQDYLMKINDFTCGFNMPPSLKGEDTNELPPYDKRPSFLVDKYPACPSNWMRSEGKAKSYFVPIKEDYGMWLDFNDNENNPYHVAIVLSIQGINPITGMACKDPQMEQYIEECPKHKIKFGPDRFCKKCNYKWPKQNYISTTATPTGLLWIDGFRSIDGIVRQYILTQEKIRGVAANIIGKNRVFSIGISFFISKEKKPIKPEILTIRESNPLFTFYKSKTSTEYPDTYTETPDNTIYIDSCDNICDNSKVPKDLSYSVNMKCVSESCVSASSSPMSWGKTLSKKIEPSNILRSRSIQCKQLEVGAGAKINQQIYDDPEHIDFWRNETEGILYINYCLEKDCQKIIEQGEMDIEGSKEGFLAEIPKGNA